MITAKFNRDCDCEFQKLDLSVELLFVFYEGREKLRLFKGSKCGLLWPIAVNRKTLDHGRAEGFAIDCLFKLGNRLLFNCFNHLLLLDEKHTIIEGGCTAIPIVAQDVHLKILKTSRSFLMPLLNVTVHPFRAGK